MNGKTNQFMLIYIYFYETVNIPVFFKPWTGRWLYSNHTNFTRMHHIWRKRWWSAFNGKRSHRIIYWKPCSTWWTCTGWNSYELKVTTQEWELFHQLIFSETLSLRGKIRLLVIIPASKKPHPSYRRTGPFQYYSIFYFLDNRFHCVHGFAQFFTDDLNFVVANGCINLDQFFVIYMRIDSRIEVLSDYIGIDFWHEISQ